jgi:hypothetical protein
MDKLNSLMCYGEKDIDISEIVSIETIESLIRSITAEQEDNDDDEYYEANKLEVTLSKVVFKSDNQTSAELIHQKGAGGEGKGAGMKSRRWRRRRVLNCKFMIDPSSLKKNSKE